MAHQNANMNSVFYATTYHPIQAGSIDGTDTASHDNGVYRALIASSTGLYDPTGDPKAEGDPYCTLVVGRLAHHTTEKTLHEAMSKYGRVKHVRLVRHIGASRGYAFVEFENDNDMQNAYEVAQHNIIDGSSILVDYNRQQLMPGWIPRRLGGGLGGRKESGQLRFGGRDRPFRAPLRPIPTEQLIKLGIPLPPVGRYMSRFQLPPIPRRPGRSSKDGAHGKQKSFSRRSPVHEASPFKSQGWDERPEVEQRAESSRLSRRSLGAERRSSAQEEHSSRQRSNGDAEENLSERLDRAYEDVKQHRKRRRHSEQEGEQPDSEKSSRSSYEDRESSRHGGRGHDHEKEHKRSHSERGDEQVDHESVTRSGHEHRESSRRHERSKYEDRESSRHGDRGHGHEKEHKSSHSERGDKQVDHESVTRSGHEHRESSRRHERSRSSSRHKHGDSGLNETSTSRSRHKDRDGGHRHKRERNTLSRESTAEHPKSPKHGSEHSKSSHSKHRRNDAYVATQDNP